MTDPRDRDDAMDRLLRQTLPEPGPDRTEASPACLDSETIAAWIDGGLSGSALAAAESHASTCARCGRIVAAMVRTEEPAVAATAAPATSATPAQTAPSAGRDRWPWLLPLAAAAAIIIAVTLPRRSAPESESAAARVAEEPSTGAATATPPAAAPVEAPKLRAELKKEAAPAESTAARKSRQPQAKAADRVAQRPDAPPAAQALGAAMESLTGRIGPFEINTPNLSIRWRVTGGVVARTNDAGATWQDVPTGITADLIAGAAPSADVCWLVGRGAIVLLTTDGRTWRRLVFPEVTDLSAVVATDARSATVTAADGRIWVTSDAGITWVRRPVQGISPAPFYE